MTSSKPYLLRALYEWILDNGLTPHVIADAGSADVEVPPQAVQDGRVVLNVSPSATRNLVMENDAISFQARFNGVSREIWMPMTAVLAIYARENGQGMMFADSDDDPSGPDSPQGPQGGKPSGQDDGERPKDGPKLRVIK